MAFMARATIPRPEIVLISPVPPRMPLVSRLGVPDVKMTPVTAKSIAAMMAKDLLWVRLNPTPGPT